MKMARCLGCLFALLFMLPLSACVVAHPAETQNMMAISPEWPAPADSTLARGICIADVQGGRQTNPMLTSQVGSPEFRQALELSLDDSGLLARQATSCRYRLTANLTELKQPWIGMSLTVSATVNYDLYDTAMKRTYLQETVTRSFTATVGDAFVGVKRLQIANEGAIRDNIHAFVSQLLGHPALASAP